MSIMDNTLRQLVINRVDDIARLTINVNRSECAVIKMAITPVQVVIEVEQDRRRMELAARLPGILTVDESLEEFELLIADAAKWLGVTPGALGVNL